MVINVKVFPHKLIFDNKNIIVIILREFTKTITEDGIEITIENGALDALYTIKQNTSYNINIY